MDALSYFFSQLFPYIYACFIIPLVGIIGALFYLSYKGKIEPSIMMTIMFAAMLAWCVVRLLPRGNNDIEKEDSLTITTSEQCDTIVKATTDTENPVTTEHCATGFKVDTLVWLNIKKELWNK